MMLLLLLLWTGEPTGTADTHTEKSDNKAAAALVTDRRKCPDKSPPVFLQRLNDRPTHLLLNAHVHVSVSPPHTCLLQTPVHLLFLSSCLSNKEHDASPATVCPRAARAAAAVVLFPSRTRSVNPTPCWMLLGFRWVFFHQKQKISESLLTTWIGSEPNTVRRPVSAEDRVVSELKG